MALVVGIATVSGLQSTAQSASSTQTVPAANTQNQSTFQVHIDLVTADAVVRDAQGHFVPDLTKDEFDVYEDGVKQDLASLTLVRGGRVFNVLVPPPPPAAEGIILPTARVQNDASGRIFLFFVDDLHFRIHDTPNVFDLFTRITKNLVHDGDMFAIVSTGVSSIAVDLTYDRRRLDEAIKKIHGSALSPGEIIKDPSGSGAQSPPELRYRTHLALSTANDVLKNLDKVKNRHKAVIYVSTGYDLIPFQGSRFNLDPNSQFTKSPLAVGNPESDFTQSRTDPNEGHIGEEFADAELVSELSQLTDAANRANATIYTMDPRGLTTGTGDVSDNVDPTELRNYLTKTQDTLRVLAEETGGFALVNSLDFDAALKRIDAETSDYYVLGYYSKNSDLTTRVHQIDVRVTRSGATVWSRKQYPSRKERGAGG